MLSPQLTTPGTRPTPSRPLEDRILELEIGVNISDSEPKTPRQQAMSERLDSYAAERDLYDVVVQGKPAPVKPSSPLRTLRFDPRWSPSPDSVDDSIAVRHAAPPAPFQPDRAARTQSPSKVAEEHYGSRSDACPPPLGQREVEALDIASVATAVLTPSRMELMIRWSANVDLLYGLTRAQRASVIKNAEVRVYREDEEIIRQDAVSQELYVVISGRCAIVLPSLEEVWQEKFPSGEQQELRDMTLGPRAKCSRDHWLEHAEKHREELLRLKDLGRGWHQEYMGVLSKRFATKWRVSTKQTREEREGTKNGPARRDGARQEARDKLLRRRSSSSRHGRYVPGKGYVKIKTEKTVCEEMQEKQKPFSDVALIMRGNPSSQPRSPRPPGPPVTMEFPPLSSFGEQRAFHNASLDGSLESGSKSAELTVCAVEKNTTVLCVYNPKDICIIKEAYEHALQEKIDFLRAHHDWGYRDAAELDLMARLMRRQWLKAGETLVSEGEDADEMYYVLRGQLSIIAQVTVDGQLAKKPVNVVGAGCSIGQMGIVMEEKKRTASCKALTDSVVLFCHRYNFMRSFEPQILAVMKERATAVIAQNAKAVHLARRAERAQQRHKRREERYAADISGDAQMMDSSSDDMEESDSDSDGSNREKELYQQNAGVNHADTARAEERRANPAQLQLSDDEYSTDDQAQVLDDESSKMKTQLALAHFLSGRAVTGGEDEMALASTSGNKDSDRSQTLTGFRPVKLSHAPKPASPSTVEEESSKLGTFSVMSFRTSSPTSPTSHSLSKISSANAGAETTRSEHSAVNQPDCGFGERSEAGVSHKRLALSSRQPVGSRRAESPVAATISDKLRLLTASQGSKEFCGHALHNIGTTRSANLSPVQLNSYDSDEQVDRASAAIGNNVRMQLGNQDRRTMVGPVARRYERGSSSTEPSAVLLSESLRSPLFRRLRNTTCRRSVERSQHARHACTLKKSKNLGTKPRPPSSPQQNAAPKGRAQSSTRHSVVGAESKSQRGKHNRGGEYANVVLLRAESPTTTRRRLALRVKVERFEAQAAHAKRRAQGPHRERAALHYTTN